MKAKARTSPLGSLDGLVSARAAQLYTRSATGSTSLFFVVLHRCFVLYCIASHYCTVLYVCIVDYKEHGLCTFSSPETNDDDEHLKERKVPAVAWLAILCVSVLKTVR